MRSVVQTVADVALLDATRDEFMSDAAMLNAIEQHFNGFISDRELIDRLAALRMFAKGRAEDRLHEESERAQEIALEDACEFRGDFERDGGRTA